MDLMQPVLGELARAYAALGLPLRSIENEWGPGQVECTFSAQEALRAADDVILFRSATRRVCRRLGCLATFMCRPALKGYYASGWHLHQSLLEDGTNLFTPGKPGDVLSQTGSAFLGGLLGHAAAATVFATPTVNGYRRFRPNSLAPDRAGRGHDHRGAMVRVLGGAGDPATRLENRLGEPAANPYLFIASQIVAGLDGVERSAHPGPTRTSASATGMENDASGPNHCASARPSVQARHTFSGATGELRRTVRTGPVPRSAGSMAAVPHAGKGSVKQRAWHAPSVSLRAAARGCASAFASSRPYIACSDQAHRNKRLPPASAPYFNGGPSHGFRGASMRALGATALRTHPGDPPQRAPDAGHARPHWRLRRDGWCSTTLSPRRHP